MQKACGATVKQHETRDMEDPNMQSPDSQTQEVRFVEVFKSKSGWAVGYLNDTPFQDGQVCLTWRPLAAGGFGGSSVIGWFVMRFRTPVQP
jgi:hypothetical protein